MDLDDSTGGGRALVLATGVAAAMLAAVMLVALTPPRSSAPNAVSATTLPALTVQLRSTAISDVDRAETGRASDDTTFGVRIERSTLSRDNALALVGAPNAVSATPTDPGGLAVGQHLPDGADRVYVLTRSHTYAVQWAQIDRVEAPDGSAVVTAAGELVASFEDGELHILVE